MNKFDINLERGGIAISNKAKRIIHFGGESVRRIEVWNDSLGMPVTIRVIYSNKKIKK